MKITKKQLKRIIQEEKTKFLRESVVDMIEFENVIESAARSVGSAFVEHMSRLPGEDPEMMADLGIDELTWEDALNEAVLELDSAIGNAIADEVQKIEGQLTSGGYAGATALINSSRRTGEF